MDFESLIPLLKNYLALYGLKVIAAIVVFVLGPVGGEDSQRHYA